MDELAAVKRAGADRLWPPGWATGVLSAVGRNVASPSEPQAADPEERNVTTADAAGEVMQHQQSLPVFVETNQARSLQVYGRVAGVIEREVVQLPIGSPDRQILEALALELRRHAPLAAVS